MIGHQPLELLAGVLAAAIGVMQQRIGLAAPPDRHHQGVGDELRRHACAHRPANDAPGEQIDDRSHVEPAFRGPDIGEVGDPFAVGCRRFEAAVEHIRSDGARLPIAQIRRQTTPSWPCFEGLQPHQSLDPVQPAEHAFGCKVLPYPPGAVGSVAAKKARANLGTKLFIATAAPTARPCQPSATGMPSVPCFRMNAFCASENRDAFIVSAPSQPGNRRGKLYLKTIQFGGLRSISQSAVLPRISGLNVGGLGSDSGNPFSKGNRDNSCPLSERMCIGMSRETNRSQNASITSVVLSFRATRRAARSRTQ